MTTECEIGLINHQVNNSSSTLQNTSFGTLMTLMLMSSISMQKVMVMAMAMVTMMMKLKLMPAMVMVMAMVMKMAMKMTQMKRVHTKHSEHGPVDISQKNLTQKPQDTTLSAGGKPLTELKKSLDVSPCFTISFQVVTSTFKMQQ